MTTLYVSIAALVVGAALGYWFGKVRVQHKVNDAIVLVRNAQALLKNIYSQTNPLPKQPEVLKDEPVENNQFRVSNFYN